MTALVVSVLVSLFIFFCGLYTAVLYKHSGHLYQIHFIASQLVWLLWALTFIFLEYRHV